MSASDPRHDVARQVEAGPEQDRPLPVPAVPVCAICEQPYSFRWSDTHGIAACRVCGLPYRLLHYDGETRLEKPPEIAIRADWLDVGRRYWQETRQRTFPAAFDFIRDRGGRSYSGASAEECELFSAWLDEHPELIPSRAADEEAEGR
jgi:hypothetical protein